MILIYKHTNLVSGKCYIGKTKHAIEKRWKSHVHAALNGAQFHLSRAIRLYPLDSWKHEILEEVETTELANVAEAKWIRTFSSNDQVFGYNMTPGGEGGQTCHPNILREKMKGRPKTAEHCQKISESNQRYWDNNPNDVRKTQLTERNKSPESIAKSKEAQTRRWAKPESREHIRALWADPIWRAKTLESRRKAKELKLQQSSS